MRPLLILALLLTLTALSAVAQEETPTPTTVSPNQTAEAEVTVGAYSITVPVNEPVVLVPLAVENNVSGKFVTYVIVVQKPSGEFIPLTACDDVAIICMPLISPAKGQLRLADPTDTFVIQEQPQ